jgi:tetratricopeptide (TPR) repeat protein
MHRFMLVFLFSLVFCFPGYTQDNPEESTGNLAGANEIGGAAASQMQSTPETVIRLIISRPCYSDYNVNKKALWIGPVIEAFLYFKLNAIDKVEVVPQGKVSAVVVSHRDFEKRISRTKYLDAGKDLNATRLLFLEYELVSEENVILYSTIERIGQSDLKKIKSTISTGDLNSSLQGALNDIVSTLGISEAEKPQEFFRMNILGADFKNMKRMGEYLLKENSEKKSGLISIADDLEKLKRTDAVLYCAGYAAYVMYEQAGSGEKAVAALGSLVDKFKNSYPKLTVLLASSYRKSDRLSEARNTIDRVSGSSNLEYAILWEKGLIYEAMKSWSVAEGSFEKLATINSSDANIYLHLAKIRIVSQKRNDATGYIRKASQFSGKSEGRIYFEIGNEFITSGDKKNALFCYQQSVTMTPDYSEAWLALGKAQLSAGLDSAAGESFVIVFNLDYIKYQEYLEKGGKLFEKKGLFDRARQVYSAAFEKYSEPKVAIMLATLEFNQQNCKKVMKLLLSLSSPWDKEPAVQNMLLKCGEDKAAPVITLRGGNPLIVNVGTGEFVDPGATAVDDADGDISYRIKVSGSVDVERFGTYNISYSVVDNSNNVATVIRKVSVIDTAGPVIELTGDESMHIVVGERFREPGFSAVDNLDGNMTGSVKTSGYVNTSNPGTYTITYSVTDGAGNTTKRERFVNVRSASSRLDNVPPVISFIGEVVTTINVGESYTEPGVNAIDNVDGDITGNINIEGEVNPSKPGFYQVTYFVSDASGNKATKTLVVSVKSKDQRENQYLGLEEKRRNTFKPQAKGKRKAVLGVITAILGLGAGGFGAYTDFMLLPKRQKEYDEAKVDAAKGKHNILRQTVLMRNVSYIAGGGIGLIFFINLCVPQH